MKKICKAASTVSQSVLAAYGEAAVVAFDDHVVDVLDYAGKITVAAFSTTSATAIKPPGV